MDSMDQRVGLNELNLSPRVAAAGTAGRILCFVLRSRLDRTWFWPGRVQRSSVVSVRVIKTFSSSNDFKNTLE